MARKKYNIVMREGLFYVASHISRSGIPQVATGTPGYPNRSQAEAWADRQADKALAAPVVEAEVEETTEEVAPATEPKVNEEVVVEVPVGQATTEGQVPDAVTNPPVNL